MIEFEVPIKTTNPLNGSWGHPMAQARKRKAERAAVYVCMPKVWLTPVLRVTFTRLSTGEMDDDGVKAALKSVRDAIAQKLGVDDKSRLVEWKYLQGKPGVGGQRIRVRIEDLERLDPVAVEVGP